MWSYLGRCNIVPINFLTFWSRNRYYHHKPIKKSSMYLRDTISLIEIIIQQVFYFGMTNSLHFLDVFLIRSIVCFLPAIYFSLPNSLAFFMCVEVFVSKFSIDQIICQKVELVYEKVKYRNNID